MDGIKKFTYSEQVAEHIKQSILEGKLAPVDLVKDVELSERQGISRAPIREAMQILAREATHPIRTAKVQTLHRLR